MILMPVFRILKQAPLTVCLTWTACILFVGVYVLQEGNPERRNEALRAWGASMPMQYFRAEGPDQIMKPAEGFLGTTDLWDGDWWRLLVNNFHHVNLLHLLVNATALIVCGRILEPRMSRVLFLLLILGAAATVGVVSGLLEEQGIGLSGILYAMVGMLIVWRDRDESVADEFTYPMVIAAGIWLVLCQILTYLDVWRVGNIAHFTGFIYGWLWGQVYVEETQKLIFRFLFGTGHLLLIPAFWFVMHPFWNGAWHYHLAISKEISNRQRLERLQTACLRDRNLADAWRQLSRIYEHQNDRRLALRVAMEGLKHNRASQPLFERTVDLGVEDALQSESPIGPELVSQVFENEANLWEKKLSESAETALNRLNWNPDELTELLGLKHDSGTEQNFSWDTGTLQDEVPEKPPELDPQAPDSAREGELF